ncbi:hypothetical protein SAMN05216327_108288 [Dyadobacter sp. SG02]|uniref:hypothetical protein n=1 Tax=Dyadobacter sp. SG02 TaxID=1855291 RepID=UPI0008CC364C|nr:hypothetical protein [Dyadobacter sp. SG02]SEJ32640.1 hypothetical protein SAMN05216327_108288 [Dyadobacter sp. SG02]
MKDLSTYVERLNAAFWTRVVTSTRQNTESISVFRIIYGLFLLTVWGPNYAWVSDMPQFYFDPPILSVANLFDDFPDQMLLLVVDFILVACALAITLGIRARIAGFAFLIFGIFATNFQFSFSKIDHNILVYATVACFSFSEWGTKLALVPDKPRANNWNEQALSILSIFVCFGFFAAGLEKGFWWTNFNMDKSGTARWLYDCFYGVRRQHLLASAAINSLPFWSYKILDFITVAFELSPIFFLIKSRLSWRGWLLATCSFHLINTMVLNISFSCNAIVYLAFIDYSRVYAYVSDSIRRRSLLFYGVGGLIVIALIARTKQILSMVPAEVIFIPKDNILGFLYFSIALWITVITVFILDFRFELLRSLRGHRHVSNDVAYQ